MKKSMTIDFFIAKLNIFCCFDIITERKYAITFRKSPINTL